MKILNTLLKFVLVTLVGCAVGYLVTFFLTPTDAITTIFIRVLQIISIGFFCGFASRIFFSHRQLLLRFLAVLFLSVISLLALDYFFENDFAINLIENGLRLPDLTEGVQMSVVAFIGILSGLIGVRRKPKTKPSPNIPLREPSPSFPKKKTVSSSSPKKIVRSQPTKSKPQKTTTIRKPAITARASKITPSSQKTLKVKSASTAKKQTIAQKKWRTAKNDIQLVGSEEHRCPYCLEIVYKGDARGVRICPECGTWHHKDCWDITGTCQVAHRNNL